MLTKEQADRIKSLNLADGVAAYCHGSAMYPAWNLSGSEEDKARADYHGMMSKLATKILTDYIDSITEASE